MREKIRTMKIIIFKQLTYDQCLRRLQVQPINQIVILVVTEKYSTRVYQR